MSAGWCCWPAAGAPRGASTPPPTWIRDVTDIPSGTCSVLSHFEMALNEDLFDVVSKKTDDLKRNGRELFENTEETLERIKKVEKSIEETSRILSKPGVNSILTEHSPSPSKNAIKKECDSVIIDIDNAISSNNAKLTNIESRLSEVMGEMRKRNDSNHIDCNSLHKVRMERFRRGKKAMYMWGICKGQSVIN